MLARTSLINVYYHCGKNKKLTNTVVVAVAVVIVVVAAAVATAGSGRFYNMYNEINSIHIST